MPYNLIIHINMHYDVYHNDWTHIDALSHKYALHYNTMQSTLLHLHTFYSTYVYSNKVNNMCT